MPNNHRDRDDLLNYLLEDIREIKQDIKSLLKFKWQIMAIAATVGSICSAIVSYVTVK